MYSQNIPLIKEGFSITENSFRGYIGVAQTDITPPIDIFFKNWGASKFDKAKGVHKPLKLNCITFQSSSSDTPLILLSADLGFWKNPKSEWFVRKQILNALSIDASHLMFCLTHTHAGPTINLEDSGERGGNLIEPYLMKIQKDAVEVIQRCIRGAVLSVLSWHYGKCNLATNRDLFLKDENRTVVGFNPFQEAEDVLLVGRIVSDKRPNKILGTIVNYACHPTTLAYKNRLISPDFVGPMRELVENHTSAPCLFLQGASGELSPRKQYTDSLRVVEDNGKVLGYAVLQALFSMDAAKKTFSLKGVVESGAPLAKWVYEDQKKYSNFIDAQVIEISLPLKKDLLSLEEINKKIEDCTQPYLKERLSRYKEIRKAIGDGKRRITKAWAWKIGDSYIIGQSNETYSRFQKEMRRFLSPNKVAVISLVNGGLGYLPPKEIYKEDVYQVWQTPFDKGSLELLIESIEDSLMGN